ncbi:MAG: response regulator [Methanobacteriota archaeon]
MGCDPVEILLVEDNPDDEQLLLFAFEKYKIIESSKIHVARDGIEALEYIFGTSEDNDLFIRHQPRLILLDLSLPKLHGLEVLKKIKSHPIARNIPVVVLTGSEKKEDWLDAHALGADSYLQKTGELSLFIEAAGWAILSAIDVASSSCYQ